MKKNGYTVIELVVVLAVFSIGYFAATWIVSKDFGFNYEEEMYKQKIDTIENNAVLYAKLNENLFEKDKTIYLTVDDLAKANAIVSGDQNVVKDPRNEDKNLNDVKVKVTNEDNKITAKVLT